LTADEEDYGLNADWNASGALDPTDRLVIMVSSTYTGIEAWFVTEVLGATALKGTWTIYYEFHWVPGDHVCVKDEMYFRWGDVSFDSRIGNFDYSKAASKVSLIKLQHRGIP